MILPTIAHPFPAPANDVRRRTGALLRTSSKAPSSLIIIISLVWPHAPTLERGHLAQKCHKKATSILRSETQSIQDPAPLC